MPNNHKEERLEKCRLRISAIETAAKLLIEYVEKNAANIDAQNKIQPRAFFYLAGSRPPI